MIKQVNIITKHITEVGLMKWSSQLNTSADDYIVDFGMKIKYCLHSYMINNTFIKSNRKSIYLYHTYIYYVFILFQNCI